MIYSKDWENPGNHKTEGIELMRNIEKELQLKVWKLRSVFPGAFQRSSESKEYKEHI